MSEEKQREIISPEGVEERVVEEVLFRITMTGGGKFRIYAGPPDKLKPTEILNSKDEAIKALGNYMVVLGSLRRDPTGTVNMLMEAMKKDLDGGRHP